MEVARELLRDHFTHDTGSPLLRQWHGEWWTWRTSHWGKADGAEIERVAYHYTERAITWNKKGPRSELLALLENSPWSPTKAKVRNLLHALGAIVAIPENIEQPAWLDPYPASAGPFTACANGILDVGRRILLPHDPSFFTGFSASFGFDPGAPAPARWTRFLGELWPDDPSAIELVAEWFGYVLSGRLDMEKALLLVGPPRAGKGVIARTLTALLAPRTLPARRWRAWAASSVWRRCSASR
jgi:putative DNA primase/helicase